MNICSQLKKNQLKSYCKVENATLSPALEFHIIDNLSSYLHDSKIQYLIFKTS